MKPLLVLAGIFVVLGLAGHSDAYGASAPCAVGSLTCDWGETVPVESPAPSSYPCHGMRAARDEVEHLHAQVIRCTPHRIITDCAVIHVGLDRYDGNGQRLHRPRWTVRRVVVR